MPAAVIYVCIYVNRIILSNWIRFFYVMYKSIITPSSVAGVLIPLCLESIITAVAAGFTSMYVYLWNVCTNLSSHRMLMPAPTILTTYLMYVQLYTSSVAGGITPKCTYLMYNSPRRLLPVSLLYVCNVQLHTSSVAAGVITPMWIYIVMVCFYFSAVSSTSQQTDSPEIPI